MDALHTSYALPVADLVDRPGQSRAVDLRLPAPEGLGSVLATVPEPLCFVGVLESVVDGILVRGTLAANLQLDCARCLEPLRHEVESEVIELFAVEGATPVEGGAEPEEGYVVSDGQLDLEVLLRDALVPSVPYRPLCRESCRGLCPTCGSNRNEVECACAEVEVDHRWNALKELRLPGDAGT